MDSSKRAVIQQFVGEVVANLKLDQFATTFGADDSTRAIFSDFPSFRALCHVCVSFLWFLVLFSPIHFGYKIGCQNQRGGGENDFDHFATSIRYGSGDFTNEYPLPLVSINSFFFFRITIKLSPAEGTNK
jgi:hypothetical protein